MLPLFAACLCNRKYSSTFPEPQLVHCIPGKLTQWVGIEALRASLLTLVLLAPLLSVSCRTMIGLLVRHNPLSHFQNNCLFLHQRVRAAPSPQPVPVQIMQTHTSPWLCQCIYIRSSTPVVLNRQWPKHDTLFDPWPLSPCSLSLSHTFSTTGTDSTLEAVATQCHCVCVCVWGGWTMTLQLQRPVLLNMMKTWRGPKTERERNRERESKRNRYFLVERQHFLFWLFPHFPCIPLSLHSWLL